MPGGAGTSVAMSDIDPQSAFPGQLPLDAAADGKISRRGFLGAGATFSLSQVCSVAARAAPSAPTNEPLILAPPIERAPTLLSAPIELAGDWGQMLPRAAELVIERMRHGCL